MPSFFPAHGRYRHWSMSSYIWLVRIRARSSFIRLLCEKYLLLVTQPGKTYYCCSCEQWTHVLIFDNFLVAMKLENDFSSQTLLHYVSSTGNCTWQEIHRSKAMLHTIITRYNDVQEEINQIKKGMRLLITLFMLEIVIFHHIIRPKQQKLFVCPFPTNRKTTKILGRVFFVFLFFVLFFLFYFFSSFKTLQNSYFFAKKSLKQ